MKINRSGFTIAELIVVIAVIGILAGITMIAFNGVQAKSRDSKRISDLQHISDAIELYRVKYNSDIGTASGCGSSNNGGGWFNYEASSSTTNYSRSILHCLNDGGYLNNSYVDPSGCASTTGTAAPGYSCTGTGYAYMKYSCTISGRTVTYVYARLESNGDATKTRNSGGCSAAYVVDTWGMNYYAVAD